MRLLPKLYKLLSKLPLNNRDLEIQTKRAAKSVSANIAEGFAKRFSEKEFNPIQSESRSPTMPQKRLLRGGDVG